MKEIFQKIMPSWLLNIIRGGKKALFLLPLYIYWFLKDICQSAVIHNKESDLADLLITSHVLEKGITMPQRRLGFGYDRVRFLIKRCKDCIQLYSENHIEIQSTITDLEQYLLIHGKEGFKLPEDILGGVQNLLKYKHENTIKCFNSTSDNYFKTTDNFKDFAYSRHSCRWYSNKEIDHDTLKKAISLAQTAPSACNRQSSRVYIIETEEKKHQVLQLQNGNRGFGHLANKILLITSDMRCWNYKTRTSAYIDAGIFTMNLLYALHYYKICACTLNAHLSISQLNQLQRIIGYSYSEMPIVFISIGLAPKNFKIAGSQRLETKQIFKFI